jgi:hypothetical protein
MADPVRLRLIYALDVVEELCVGDLALALEVSEDSVSYALRLLRSAGLVLTRRDGRVIFNRLADDFPQPLRDHCLRQLVALTRTDDVDASEQRAKPDSRRVTLSRPARLISGAVPGKILGTA